HGERQTPRQNPPAEPVHHRHQVDKSPGHRNIGVSRPEGFHLQPLAGRVEDWRAGRPWYSRPFHVSSPLHVARNVRISRIARPHLLHAEAYGTYPAGATFGPSRRPRAAV